MVRVAAGCEIILNRPINRNNTIKLCKSWAKGTMQYRKETIIPPAEIRFIAGTLSASLPAIRRNNIMARLEHVITSPVSEAVIPRSLVSSICKK